MPVNETARVVRYDAETHARAILRILEQLLLGLQQPAWRESTGEAWLAHVAVDLERVRTRLGQPFALLVVGDFKRGKSTLINALLGQKLVTMDVAPETVVVTEVHYGPAVRVEARLLDGGRVDLRPDDLPSERLSPILENLPGPVDVVRIEAPAPFLDGLTIIDSPGTGDLLWRFDRRVQEYLPRADAVLHVVSAVSPLSETERGFLRLSLRPLDLAKVVFVVNQLDQMRTADDASRVVRRVADSLQDMFPDSAVLGVSALHALSRATEDELPRPERAAELDEAFEALRRELRDRVLLHRDVVRNERGAHEAESLLQRAVEELVRLQRALEVDRGAVRDALSAAQDKGSAARRGITEREARLRTAILGLGEQSAGWMDGLVTRIERDVLPDLGRLGHEDVQRHFPFFLGETLRDGLSACIDTHQDIVLALVDEVSRDAATALGAALGDHLRGAADPAAAKAGFHTPAWTVIDHLHVVGAVLTAVTGILGPIVQVLAGVADRTAATSQRGEHYRGKVADAIPSLRVHVRDAVRKAYADLADAVCTQVRSVQEEELARVAGELTHALTLHDRGVERIGDTGAALTAIVARVNTSISELSDLRKQLRAVAS